jgi:hypothetical protein
MQAGSPHKARPHPCDAADARRCNDRNDHDRDGVAAAFGARLSGRCPRKKLRLNLVSEQTDKGRVYRIKDGKASSATADRAKQAA